MTGAGQAGWALELAEQALELGLLRVQDRDWREKSFPELEFYRLQVRHLAPHRSPPRRLLLMDDRRTAVKRAKRERPHRYNSGIYWPRR